MSRTDKDRPYWVKVRDRRVPTVERHWHHGLRWRRWRQINGTGCDLAEFDAATDRTAKQWFNCERHLAAEYHRRYHRDGPAPRWFTHHVWFEPERVRERDRLGEIVKEYHAHREVEDYDFPNHQHNHNARWLWD